MLPFMIAILALLAALIFLQLMGGGKKRRKRSIGSGGGATFNMPFADDNSRSPPDISDWDEYDADPYDVLSEKILQGESSVILVRIQFRIRFFVHSIEHIPKPAGGTQEGRRQSLYSSLTGTSLGNLHMLICH